MKRGTLPLLGFFGVVYCVLPVSVCLGVRSIENKMQQEHRRNFENIKNKKVVDYSRIFLK